MYNSCTVRKTNEDKYKVLKTEKEERMTNKHDIVNYE